MSVTSETVAANLAEGFCADATDAMKPKTATRVIRKSDFFMSILPLDVGWETLADQPLICLPPSSCLFLLFRCSFSSTSWSPSRKDFESALLSVHERLNSPWEFRSSAIPQP